MARMIIFWTCMSIIAAGCGYLCYSKNTDDANRANFDLEEDLEEQRE